MSAKDVVLAMLLISISHIAVGETADGAKVDYSVILEGLPWEFKHTSTPLGEKPEKAEAGNHAHLLVQGTASGDEDGKEEGSSQQAVGKHQNEQRVQVRQHPECLDVLGCLVGH